MNNFGDRLRHQQCPGAIELDTTECDRCHLPLVRGWCARRTKHGSITAQGTVVTIVGDVWEHASCDHARHAIINQFRANEAALSGSLVHAHALQRQVDNIIEGTP